MGLLLRTAAVCLVSVTLCAGRSPAAASEPAGGSSAAPTAQAIPADPKAQAASFVQSYAAVAPERHAIARWFNPLCVRVVGLAPAQDAAVQARILEVGKAVGAVGYKVVGAGAPASGCRGVNIEIGFTNDPQGMLDGVIKDAKRLLGDQTSGTGADRTVTRPIQAWYLTNGSQYAANSADRNGADGLKILVQQNMAPQPTGPFGPGAIATPDISDNSGSQNDFRMPWPDTSIPWPEGESGRSRQFLSVLVIVDLRNTGNRNLAVLTDYVAMLVLSQPSALDHCNALPSITDLYAGPCPGRAAPDGLTAADAAYLAALYAGQPDKGAGEQTAVVDRMAGILAKTKVAAR